MGGNVKEIALWYLMWLTMPLVSMGSPLHVECIALFGE